MGDPRIDSLHDPYEDQLSAARYKAERDAAVQELQAMRERNIELWMESGMANELVTCAEDKAERLGKLVWRLQNRLARSHRREKALRKGMREWREKAIGGPVRTVSAYDLLPEEDLQALRWVREHGGLDGVKKLLDWVVGHCSTKQQLDFDFWLSGRVMYELGFDEDMADRDEVEGRLLARLMPEGCKWPRYKDGRPVRFGDAGLDVHGKRRMVGGVKFTQDGFAFISDDRGRTWWANDRGPLEEPEIDPDKCVKSPADTAWDGKPLEVGQTVWGVKDGKEFVVVRPSCGDGLTFLKYRTESGGYVYTADEPEHLTHTKPEQDSWDSVWMDVSNGVETPQGMKRRCKAIAERGE